MATYYVDFQGGSDGNNGTSTSTPWRRVKGMTNITGGSVAALATITDGDIIVFKGGVTWTASFPWNISFGSGAMVTYTTDHTWFNGASWSQPRMDDENRIAVYNATPGATVRATNCKFLTINDINWSDTQTTSIAARTVLSAGFYFDLTAHDITFTNNTFSNYTWLNIYIQLGSAGSYSNFIFTGNDISNTSMMARIGSSSTGVQVHNVQILNNTMHDVASMLGGDPASSVDGFHGDGFLHYFANSATGHADPTEYLDGLIVANNRTYGDWRNIVDTAGGIANTAMVYCEGSASAIYYNNDFSFSPLRATASFGIFSGLIYHLFYNNPHPSVIELYNNTLIQPVGTGNAMTAGLFIRAAASGTVTVTAKNNIIANMPYAVNYTEYQGAVVQDYNLLLSTTGSVNLSTTSANAFKTYAQWKALGYDQNPALPAPNGTLGVDPLVIAVETNNHLQAGSPAINVGVNLTSLGIAGLNVDRDGNARPTGSVAWTMGAYSVGDALAPAAPTGITVQ